MAKQNYESRVVQREFSDSRETVPANGNQEIDPAEEQNYENRSSGL